MIITSTLLSFGCLFASVGPGRPPEFDPNSEYLPNGKGVYRVIDQNNTVQYVGSSNNVDRRVQEHIKSGMVQPGDTVSVTSFHGNTGQNTVCDYEVKEIDRLNPVQNIHPGGPGRPWKN